MDDEALEQLAASLSIAAREFIPTITYDDWWRTDEETPRGVVGPLTMAGILESENGLGGKIYRLTDLGKQVRAHLTTRPSTSAKEA